MDTTWIVLADEGRARILQRSEPGADLEDVEELIDAAAHAHNADLRRDAMGRRSPADGHGAHAGTHMPGSSTSSAGEEKLDHEAELFARRLALRLSDARRAHRYDRLRIAAAPRFLGRLRKELDTEVCSVLDDAIDKDLLQLDRRTLTQRFFPDAPRSPHPPAA
jgi:protein required for attachment to host cells